MNKTFKTLFVLAACIVLAGMSSCSSSNDDHNQPAAGDVKTPILQALAVQYTDQVVISTYHHLADACQQLQHTVDNLQTDADLQTACTQWRQARKFWEWSEAFLFGAASNYGIDPHIDTWPFDETSFKTHLDTFNPDDANSVANMQNTISTGQNLTGFHALEWLIFRQGEPRKMADLSRKEQVYAQLVAEDLYLSAVRLEAAWAGIEKVSDSRQALLAEAEMEPGEDFGSYLRNAGQAGSIYKTPLAAVIQIIDGCRDIADEVASAKIGKPATGEDVAYIESPHAYNSIVDFYDNLLSCKHALYGMLSDTEGDFSHTLTTPHSASVMTYALTYCPAQATATRDALETALSKIEAMKRPFVLNYTDATAQEAIEAINAFDEALGELEEAIK